MTVQQQRLVLTQAIVREGLKNVTAGANPVGIRRGIELATKAAVEELHRISRPVESKEAIARCGHFFRFS